MKEAQVGQWMPGTRKVVRCGDSEGMLSDGEVVAGIDLNYD